MTHASLFSGIGGPEVAAAMLGWENLFHCEINPFGRKVLEYWFPNSVSYEDITKTSFKEWRGKVDVLTGGFPCQPFSYAGKRGGAEDARYLWPEMLRAIDEIRPSWVVGENVAGLATMVEGWLPTEVGRGSSLFEAGANIHDWVVEQTYTVERIAGELEGLGYSVQPVLVPAAACGAPHRRDRIFILAFDADADRRDDVRGSGEDEGKGGEERVQERHEIRDPRKPGELRPEIQESAANPASDGLHGSTREDGKERCIDSDGKRVAAKGSNGVGLRSEFGIHGEQFAATDTASRGSGALSEHIHTGQPDVDLSICYGRKRDASDTHGAGREKSQQPGREEAQAQDEARLHDRIERPCGDGYTSHSVLAGLERTDESGASEGGQRVRVRRDTPGYDWENLRPENRWAEFPTISPVHRGNDGIPFDVDRLTISFSRWRTESLKAYGNAIVPQVMYRIFEAIESITIK